MSGKPKIVITDYDYGDVSVETAILEAAGAEVIALQAKNQEDLFEAAQDCFGMMNQYARIGAETIAHMQQCPYFWPGRNNRFDYTCLSVEIKQ